ncbi:MAG: Omp28-related outer membrane protein, partial [Candidatus Kuenenia stuttgartiensis]|nr:Omp28-related outer membrane protein [Candidatus Kuenenia stuttgartiensis]
AILKLKFAYTSEVLINHNYTVGIIEDSIIDAQKDGLEIIKEYVHKHVLRDIITPIYGTPVPEKVKPFIPGKVYEHSIRYTLDSSWKASRSSFIVFLHNSDGGNKEVLQAEEIPVIN